MRKALKAQHEASAAFIRTRMERPMGLTEPERDAFAGLLRAQAQAWQEAGGDAAAFAGADVLGVLAQPEQPAAPPASEPRPARRKGR